MSSSEGGVRLPAGWRAEANENGMDLRVSSSGRGYMAACAGVLAGLTGWTAFRGNSSSTWSANGWLVPAFLFSVLALWCAFGDEVWQLRRNCLVHRVGIRGVALSRRYQDAELNVVLRFSSKFGVPCYRLYAVVDGKYFFLIERRRQELLQLADFISAQTGWRVRSDGVAPLP